MPELSDRLTIFVITGINTEAHSLRSQVGMGSESDCLLGQLKSNNASCRRCRKLITSYEALSTSSRCNCFWYFFPFETKEFFLSSTSLYKSFLMISLDLKPNVSVQLDKTELNSNEKPLKWFSKPFVKNLRFIKSYGPRFSYDRVIFVSGRLRIMMR